MASDSEQPSDHMGEVLPKSNFPVPTKQTPVYPPKIPHSTVPIPVAPAKKPKTLSREDFPPPDPNWKDKYMVDGKLTTPYNHSDEPEGLVLEPLHPPWWPGWPAMIKANPEIPDRIARRREYRNKHRKPARSAEYTNARFSPYPAVASSQDER